MVVVAVAFVIGGILGAVLTAALIARGQRALELTPSDLELPIRPADRWRAEHGADASRESCRMPRTPGSSASTRSSPAGSGAKLPPPLANATVAANHALRPGFGIMIRMKG